MHVSRLALTDFRSYPEVLLELDPGCSALIGPLARWSARPSLAAT